MNDPLFTKISPHLWIIHGTDRARFPSGNALLIWTRSHLVLIDTNPGFERIDAAIQQITGGSSKQISEIFLSHTHLDHGRGIADLANACSAGIFAHRDTLQRCQKKVRIGLYAGVSPIDIKYFEQFGESLGFKDQTYPESRLHPINDGDRFQFDEVSVFAHETFGHCVHMFDYECNDTTGSIRIILSCDFDFSAVPWYGVPQRGDSISLFKADTRNLITRQPQLIVSSHRLDPLPRERFEIELTNFFAILDARTERVIGMLQDTPTILSALKNFVYPLDKMIGKYSEAYIRCASCWDTWLILAHLEDAWRLERVECIDAGGDPFLSHCISQKRYVQRKDDQLLGIEWASETLKERCPWILPIESKWQKKV